MSNLALVPAIVVRENTLDDIIASVCANLPTGVLAETITEDRILICGERSSVGCCFVLTELPSGIIYRHERDMRRATWEDRGEPGHRCQLPDSVAGQSPHEAVAKAIAEGMERSSYHLDEKPVPTITPEQAYMFDSNIRRFTRRPTVLKAVPAQKGTLIRLTEATRVCAGCQKTILARDPCPRCN